MIRYCKILDEEKGLVQLGAGCTDEYYIEIGMEKRQVKQSDIDFQWYLYEKCPMKSKEEKEREEQERIANLTLTRGDVFAGLIQARMIDESYIRTIIERLPEETTEQKKTKMLSLNALTNALNFHRNHPLVDTMGEQLGISSDNLNKFFDTNDWHYLLPTK